MKFDVNDIVGKKFGRLTVLSFDHKINFYSPTGGISRSKSYYLCQCECGNIKVVRKDQLKDGTTQSCGCLKKEQNKINLNTSTHKLSNSRLNSIYRGIKKRCYNPNCKAFPHYGGRGIVMCEEWLLDFMTFYNWSIENGYNSHLTIDRIDCNKNYSPDNCRWVDMKTQQRNRTNNRIISYNGESRTLSEWAEFLNVEVHWLRTRVVKNKIPLAEIITSLH